MKGQLGMLLAAVGVLVLGAGYEVTYNIQVPAADTGKTVYVYVKQARSWNEASEICRRQFSSQAGSLARIDNDEAHQVIAGLIKQENHDAWFGLYNEGGAGSERHFKWSDVRCTDFKFGNFSKFKQANDENGLKEERCYHLSDTGTTWSSDKCITDRWFVCQYQDFNDSSCVAATEGAPYKEVKARFFYREVTNASLTGCSSECTKMIGCFLTSPSPSNAKCLMGMVDESASSLVKSLVKNGCVTGIKVDKLEAPFTSNKTDFPNNCQPTNTSSLTGNTSPGSDGTTATTSAYVCSSLTAMTTTQIQRQATITATTTIISTSLVVQFTSSPGHGGTSHNRLITMTTTTAYITTKIQPTTVTMSTTTTVTITQPATESPVQFVASTLAITGLPADPSRTAPSSFQETIAPSMPVTTIDASFLEIRSSAGLHSLLGPVVAMTSTDSIHFNLSPVVPVTSTDSLHFSPSPIVPVTSPANPHSGSNPVEQVTSPANPHSGSNPVEQVTLPANPHSGSNPVEQVTSPANPHSGSNPVEQVTSPANPHSGSNPVEQVTSPANPHSGSNPVEQVTSPANPHSGSNPVEQVTSPANPHSGSNPVEQVTSMEESQVSSNSAQQVTSPDNLHWSPIPAVSVTNTANLYSSSNPVAPVTSLASAHSSSNPPVPATSSSYPHSSTNLIVPVTSAANPHWSPNLVESMTAMVNQLTSTPVVPVTSPESPHSRPNPAVPTTTTENPYSSFNPFVQVTPTKPPHTSSNPPVPAKFSSYPHSSSIPAVFATSSSYPHSSFNPFEQMTPTTNPHSRSNPSVSTKSSDCHRSPNPPVPTPVPGKRSPFPCPDCMCATSQVHEAGAGAETNNWLVSSFTVTVTNCGLTTSKPAVVSGLLPPLSTLASLTSTASYLRVTDTGRSRTTELLRHTTHLTVTTQQLKPTTHLDMTTQQLRPITHLDITTQQLRPTTHLGVASRFGSWTPDTAITDVRTNFITLMVAYSPTDLNHWPSSQTTQTVAGSLTRLPDVENMRSAIISELLLDDRELSRSRRTRESAPDDRLSAQISGSLAVVIVLAVLSCVVIIDLPRMLVCVRDTFVTLKTERSRRDLQTPD